jgi:hypothetical protein
MRSASARYLGVALLVTVSVSAVSFQLRGATAARTTGPKQTGTILLVPGDDGAVRRMQAKSDVARQLIDGQKTLMEAAAWFRYINLVTTLPGVELNPGDKSQSEGERTCRQVIRWAVAAVQADVSDHGAALARRLEMELKEALDRPGGIVLPEVE